LPTIHRSPAAAARQTQAQAGDWFRAARQTFKARVAAADVRVHALRNRNFQLFIFLLLPPREKRLF